MGLHRSARSPLLCDVERTSSRVDVVSALFRGDRARVPAKAKLHETFSEHHHQITRCLNDQANIRTAPSIYGLSDMCEIVAALNPGAIVLQWFFFYIHCCSTVERVELYPLRLQDMSNYHQPDRPSDLQPTTCSRSHGAIGLGLMKCRSDKLATSTP